MQKKTPNISIIIPTLNEAEFIEECVLSLLNGNYSKKKLEILIVDGGSSDETRTIANELSNQHSNIHLINNPKRIVPCAINTAVKQAKHDYILWCGSHAIYDSQYIQSSLNVLLEEDCASSGGVLTPIAKTNFGKSIAIATTNKFGIGNALYRHAKKRQTTNTVFGGFFKKENFNKIGGLNEHWVRNQDVEFNRRLKEMVGPIIVDPNIKCQYYCRETITQLAQQYFQYGYWRFKTTVEHPNTFSLRLAAPVALVIGFCISTGLLLCGMKVGLLLPSAYLISNILASLHTSIKKKSPKLLIHLPVIFTTIHFSWGAGFIKSSIDLFLGRLFTIFFRK